MKILYAARIGLKNIVDDLRLDVFRLEAESHGATVVPSYPPREGDNQLAHIQNELKKADRVVIGGGPLLSSEYYLTAALLAAKSRKPLFFWGTGLDSVDRETARALAFGEKIKKVKLEGVKTELLKSALEAAERIYTRGPLTKDALAALGPSFTRAKEVGDPAFLTDPEEEVPLKIFSSKKPVIAISWKPGQGKEISLPGEDEFFNALEALSRWFSFLFFPITPGAAETYKRWSDKLSTRAEVKVIGRIPNAALLAGWLKRCHLVIGTDPDAVTLAVAAETPFIALGANTGSYDIAASAGAEDNICVPTPSQSLTRAILDLTNDISARHGEISSALKDYRAALKRKLKSSITSTVS